MKLKNLTLKETEIVRSCLQCAADGKVLNHHAEFHAVIGVSGKEFIKIFGNWPKIDETNKTVNMAINNTLLNLLEYPHDYHESWNEIMDAPLDEIRRIFNKWRRGK